MKTIRSMCAGLVVFVATIPLSDLSYSQSGAVLDASQHPLSPEFVRGFSEILLPLDTTLSWTKRFNGNEEFNETVTLMPTSDGGSDRSVDLSLPMDSMQKHTLATDAVGTVEKILTDQKKIKIKHEPIERLGMPAMTMLFKVEDVAMLEDLVKGQQVEFSVNNSSSGFMLTHIVAVSDTVETRTNAPNSAAAMDARGTVKSIRSKDGKIKIEHGPIERIGMPAMTMVFKVENPVLLNGIEKGAIVDFSIDNSSGGFVITNLRSVE